jgi:sugar phosphate isomerase/epimerase
MPAACSRRALFALPALAFAAPRTKMTIHLSAGAIGVKADQRQALDFAHRFGYEAIDAQAGLLAAMDDAQLRDFRAEMQAKGIVWGTAGLSVDFRTTEENYLRTLAAFPAQCAALQRAGAARVCTWISPTHNELPYLANLRLHARRLRECARIAGDHGLRVGLEYVGPKTSWTARRFPFVHSMAQMKELLAEIGSGHVGFVLDSWHWYTAGESVDDLKTLTAWDIVSVDLNDAPAGRARDEQKDLERELPMATGVIDLAGFLNTLNALGCDAPVRCEPFNAPLRAMPPEQALQATVTAMKKAFDLIR